MAKGISKKLMSIIFVAVFVCILVVVLCSYGKNENTFPENFLFGTSSSSYQVEGAWNSSDKGENIWDRFTHKHPERITDRTNGDVAADSYHNIDRDVMMLKQLGVNFYRFSLSWSRVLPTGFANQISKDGIDYYNRLIDALLVNNIEPHVVLHHWDLPVQLAAIGGFTNEIMIDYFEDYARVAFERFGDRVKTWSTFNEPLTMCAFGYGGGALPPGYDIKGISNYLCTSVLLKSHARVYHMYHDKYRKHKEGKIGITNHFMGILPQSISEEDRLTVQRASDFLNDMFLQPIYSRKGDYPEEVKSAIRKNSLQQGFVRSRLPEFTEEEIHYIRGTADFMGINYYTSAYGVARKSKCGFSPSFCEDMNITMVVDEKWPKSASAWLRIFPEAFRIHLNYLKDRYDNPPVLITENGLPTYGGLNDLDRVSYMNEYLQQLLYAKNIDGCNVIGYTAWSLMDNFEWLEGLTRRFGIYETDFDSPEKKTYPRMSALVYSEIIKTRAIKKDYLPYQNERNVTYTKYISNILMSSIIEAI